MKFRKKPVVIEAIQWTGDNEGEIIDFTHSRTLRNVSQLIIPTLEGDMLASKMDWIIKGVNGEFYPCKPDIFEKTYEHPDETTSPTSPVWPDKKEVEEAAWDYAENLHCDSYPKYEADKAFRNAIQWLKERAGGEKEEVKEPFLVDQQQFQEMTHDEKEEYRAQFNQPPTSGKGEEKYSKDDLLNFFSFGRMAETNGISFETHFNNYYKFAKKYAEYYADNHEGETGNYGWDQRTKEINALKAEIAKLKDRLWNERMFIYELQGEIAKLKSGEQFSREDMHAAFHGLDGKKYFEEWLNDYLTEVKQKK